MTGAISSLTSHNPIVNVLITPNYNNDGRKARITLTNNGSAPASNLSLTIIAPKKITQIIDNFSAESISSPQLSNSNNRLSLGTPKPIDPPTLFLQIFFTRLALGKSQYKNTSKFLNNIQRNLCCLILLRDKSKPPFNMIKFVGKTLNNC